MASNPDHIEAPREVLSLLSSDESVRWVRSTDIRLDGNYGVAWLMATEYRLIAFSPNNEGRNEVVEFPFEEIESVEIESLYGSAALRVRTAEFGATIALFSKTLAFSFAEAPAELERLIREARPEATGRIALGHIERGVYRQRRCESCNAVIPRYLGVCPACLESSKLLGRFMSYSKPYWSLALASLVILLIGTFIGLTPPLLMRILIDDVLDPVGQNSGSTLVNLPYVETVTPTYALGTLVILLLLINISRNALGALRSYLLSRLGEQITYDLRSEVYQHLHRLSLNFYNDRETGRIMASVTQDVGRLQDFLSDGLQETIRNILTIIIIISILTYLDIKLALCVLLPTPIIVFTTLRFGTYLHKLYRPLYRRWAGISALLADVVPGVRVVKAFAQEDREVNRFETRSLDLLKGELSVAKTRSLFAPLMTFLTSIGTLLIWWIGGNKVINGLLTLGDFVAFTGYMWQFYGPVESLCHLNHRFQRAATSAERVFEVLDSQPDVVDPPNAPTMPKIQGSVEFRDVSFSYEEGKNALKNLNFTVEPGEMIGLAGHSGAGKSTIINLICRFYEIDDGSIYIDDIDTRSVSLKSLREQIGVVLQDPFLFNGTVAENIAYGNPEATQDAIIAAAKAANAHEFIINLPDSYDSTVGERAVRLSGGERQRLSIARAILRNPRILILDEATSSMDTETEAKIQEALARLVKGRTTFAIAHRLSTLRNADRLFIIEKGQLYEQGTHDDLVAQNGIYAKLVRMQMEMSRIRAV
jgi:ATP-binding cassette subfamily B protein